MHTNATHGDFYGFRNMEQLSENPVEMDFDILHRLKQDYPSKVVIASIMGQTEEEWVRLAKMAEEAGCDAVELNFSCPQMKHKGMGSDVGQSPELVKGYTACVKRSVKIPVISKMTPNITHIAEPAAACLEAGADAISAINTIKSVTMDADAEVAGQRTISGYSGRAVRPIALRHVLELAQLIPTPTPSRREGSLYRLNTEAEAGCNQAPLGGLNRLNTETEAGCNQAPLGGLDRLNTEAGCNQAPLGGLDRLNTEAGCNQAPLGGLDRLNTENEAGCNQAPLPSGGVGGGYYLSGVGGIETWRDALEFIQLGCSNVQVCTAVMQYGYRIIDDLILGLQRYMAKRGISQLSQLVGEQLPKFLKPDHLNRDTIIYPKFDRDLCIGCGRCEVSCSDGGHQAIAFDSEARRPRLIGSKCVGCHLCRLVCPAGAIGMTKRISKK
jgi:dihydroorotate dehydrogenase/Pyruvate/2-oxoacid:ferredoxin oxidoreductase delta subunit